MSYLIFSVTILYVLVTVQAQHIKFGQNKASLSACIESYLLKDPRSQIKNNAKLIADISSEHFRGKTLDMYMYRLFKTRIFHVLKTNHSHLFDRSVISVELKNIVNEGLENCVERQSIPRFRNESRELADVLDFVLVDWPTPLYDMVRSQEGRDILRMYAYNLGVKLLTALRHFSMNHNLLRRELQVAWMQRAQHYFDVSVIQPNLRHRFTTYRDRLYSSIPLDEIHTPDYVVLRESQEVTRPSLADTTLPEHQYILNRKMFYLETHLKQSYRILFFILELQAIGIVTAEDDIYTGAIPYHVLPEHLQRLVYHDQAYRHYLPVLRERLEVEFSECFPSSTEEDLIMLFVQWIMERNPLTTTTVATTITTSTNTTSNDQQGLKKGGVRKHDCGKYFSPNKQLRTADSEPNLHQNTNSVSGFQRSNFDLDPEESAVFMDVLDEVFVKTGF